ncbi:MAG: exosortase A [Hyphococcus sp.]
MTATAIEPVEIEAADIAVDKKAHPWTAPVIACALLTVAAIVLLHPTAWAMASTWATSSTYVHGFAVAPIALWLMRSRSVAIGGAMAPGLAIVVIGAMLWLMGRAATLSLLQHLAFVTVLIGIVGAVFGDSALRAWAFPLAFLYFMVPFSEIITPQLQLLTAQGVVSLLSMLGGDVALDGFLITTPAGRFLVAEACAGLNFLIAALMIATVFAIVSFQRWEKRLAFILFALIAAIVMNSIRAFLIIMIATLSDHRWAVGPDHVLVGWVFYLAVITLLLLIGMRFADAPRMQGQPPEWAARPHSVIAPACITAALLFAAAAYAYAVIDKPIVRAAPASISLVNAPGWRILPPQQHWRAALPKADRTAAATYASPAHVVSLSLGYFTHERDDIEIATAANRVWSGADWRSNGREQAVLYLFGHSQKTSIELLSGPGGRRLAVVTAYWLDTDVYVEPWRLKLTQMIRRLKGENPRGGVIMIAAAYNEDVSDAITALRAFTTDIESFDDWRGRLGA